MKNNLLMIARKNILIEFLEFLIDLNFFILSFLKSKLLMIIRRKIFLYVKGALQSELKNKFF